MVDQHLKQLAPNGVLSAGVFLGNPLLISGKTPDGTPMGISPDLASEIAARLGVSLKLLPFTTQDALVDAVASGECAIGLVGADPERAKKVQFSPAYVEIPASYMVPAGSKIQTIDEVDRTGVRIASYNKSAYDLWLVRNIRNAEIVHADSYEASFQLFVDNRLDAVAALRKSLDGDVGKLPGARILDGQFMAVQQGIATANAHVEATVFLKDFVLDIKSTGYLSALINQYKAFDLKIPEDSST